jgi:hypothetical protein
VQCFPGLFTVLCLYICIFDVPFVHLIYSVNLQVTALSNIEAKKRFEFLEAVSGTMDAHLRYFKQVLPCYYLHFDVS